MKTINAHKAHEEATEHRQTVLKNGWRPLPTAEKVAFLPQWPQIDIDEKEIRSWPVTVKRYSDTGVTSVPAVTTAIQMTGTMVGIDVDVDNREVSDAIEELLMERLGARWNETPYRHSGGAKFLVLLRTDEPYRMWKTQKYKDPDGNDHMVEVYGGASTRYFSCFGPHSLGKVVKGEYEVLREYQWMDDLSPLTMTPDDLPLVTVEEVDELMLAIGDVLAEKADGLGWEELTGYGHGHLDGGVEYDLSDDMEFDTKDGLLSYDDAIGFAVSERDPRCSGSFLDGESRNKTRCKMSVVPNGDGLQLAVFDYESWTMHYHESQRPRTVEEQQEKSSGLGELLRRAMPEDVGYERGWEDRGRVEARQDEAQADPGDIEPTVFTIPKASDLKPRPFVFGDTFLRGAVTLTVAPGGLGKSAWSIVEALAMATGKKEMTGDEVKGTKPLKVWLWNGEDDRDELNRRLAAACQNYRITNEDLGGRLMVDSGRTMPIEMVRSSREKGVVVALPIQDRLIEMLRKHEVDVLIIDPLVVTHNVDENDNGGMSKVADAWIAVAQEANCAIHMVHHVNKAAAMNGNDQGIYGARGASAIIDRVRVARVMIRMSDDEGGQMDVTGSSSRYVKLIDGKKNYTPMADEARWFHLKSVILPMPSGDSVGVPVLFTPPTASEKYPLSMIREVLQTLENEFPLRESPQAKEWAGYRIAEVRGEDIGPRGAKASTRTGEQHRRFKAVEALINHMVKGEFLWIEKAEDTGKGRDTPLLKLGATGRDLLDDPSKQEAA